MMFSTLFETSDLLLKNPTYLSPYHYTSYFVNFKILLHAAQNELQAIINTVYALYHSGTKESGK